MPHSPGHPSPDATYTFRSEAPDPEAYFELFRTTGWNERYRATPADLDRVNRQSWYVVAAYEGERLVGFGRVVSDTFLHAMIYDMIVAPDRRGRGIGSRVLSLLVDRCRAAGIRDVQLFCARGKEPFYVRHGFRPRPLDAPGMQLADGTDAARS